MFKQGNKVNGEYCGVAFAGTVTAERYHTMAHEYQYVTVTVDKPITVHGETRESVMMLVHDETGIGSKGETYVQRYAEWVPFVPETEEQKRAMFMVVNFIIQGCR